jgi:hypothetical protein
MPISCKSKEWQDCLLVLAVVKAFDRTCETEWRTGYFEKISAQRRAERQNRAARRPQRLHWREDVGKQIYEGIRVMFERKIDGNRPFADLEKLMFGGGVRVRDSYSLTSGLPSCSIACTGCSGSLILPGSTGLRRLKQSTASLRVEAGTL